MSENITKYPGGGKIKPVYNPDQELKDNFNKTLVYDNNRSIKDVVLSAAKRGNINPSFLLSSAWQEGFNKSVLKPDDVSTAYSNAAKKDKSLNDFPIDGFYNYGLDTFGSNYDKLKKYLPEGFDKNFKTYDAVNEKNEKIKTVAFRNNEDALVAKAAYLNSMRDDVLSYAKQKGLNNLDQRTSDYFTLASYNGGLGNARKIIDQYQSSPDQANFIDKGLTQQLGVHKNILPRLNRERLADELLGITTQQTPVTNVTTTPIVTTNTTQPTMKKGGRIKYEIGGPIDGDPKLNDQKVPGINVWDNAVNTPSPINPDAPKEQQIFRLDEKGTVQTDKTPIIPLSQFYDQSTDPFGNKTTVGTGNYVNGQGETNTTASQQIFNDQLSAQNKSTAGSNYQKKSQIEIGASLGITAINEFFNKKNQGKEDRTNLRKGIMDQSFTPTFNPYPQGTGSQAIMKMGGEISGENQGVKVLDGGKTKLISSSDHSNPMMEFTGKTHDEGGIGVAYGGKIAEVEDKEIGFVDKDGGLNVFGKLKFPGSNETFKKVAKDIAKKEDKVDSEKSKYINILNNTEDTNKYGATALSTAKVMFKSLDKQSKELADKKEGLASFQNLILNMTKPQQVDLDKDNDSQVDVDRDKMKYGGRMKMGDGGELDPKDPDKIQKIIDKYSNGKSPLKAQDFIEVSQKYGVPLDLMLAQAIQESSIGTKGMATKSHNIFNVKNNGNTGRLTDMGDWRSGLENYAKLLKNEYSTNGAVDTQTLLSSGFKRPKLGGSYAEEGNYTSALTKILNTINPGSNYTLGNTSNNAAKDMKSNSGEPKYKLQDGQTYTKAELKDLYEWSDSDLQKNLSNGVATQVGDDQSPTSNGSTKGSIDDFVPHYTPITQIDKTIDTPYGAAFKSPAMFSDKINIGTGDRARGYLSPLALEQIAPELLTMATNKKDPVTQLDYQPALKQTFDISYQLGRNENQSSFNQAAKIAESTGNVDALSQLAAQKYKADENYNMQEIQGNATQKLGVYGQNTDTLNDARLKNLALIADQQTKQAQAKFNTRKEDLGAFASIAGKDLQNQLENKTYNAYSNLFKNYGFDKKGNVTFDPGKVVNKFNEGEAQQFGFLAATGHANDLNNSNASKTITTSDGDGNVKKVTKIDSDLEEFNSIMNSKTIDETKKKKILAKRQNSIFVDGGY